MAALSAFQGCCMRSPVWQNILGKAEMRRAARLAQKWKVSVEDEIWYCTHTKTGKACFLAKAETIHASTLAGISRTRQLSITLKSGHIMRCVGFE